MHTILSLGITSYIIIMYYPLFINHLYIHHIIRPLSNISLGYPTYKVVIFSLIWPLGSFKMKKKDRPYTNTLVVTMFSLESDCFFHTKQKGDYFFTRKICIVLGSHFTKIFRSKLQCQIIYPLPLSSQYFFI